MKRGVVRKGIRERHASAGFTLVELIVSIVIIAVALTGVTLLTSSIVARSADPLIQQQAAAIAEAYLEEVLARPFGDSTGATSRPDYETIGDYHGLMDAPPLDQFGNKMNGVADYSVTVQVVVGAGNASIGEGLGEETGDHVARIDVTVTHPLGGSMQLSGYRLDY